MLQIPSAFSRNAYEAQMLRTNPKWERVSDLQKKKNARLDVLHDRFCPNLSKSILIGWAIRSCGSYQFS